MRKDMQVTKGGCAKTILMSLFMAAPLWANGQTAHVVQRKANYYPDGQAFVCVNGNNRYTRALYGSIDEWRLETSDRPIFAIFKKNSNRNIRFRVKYEGQTLQLDSAEYCEARYEAGRRDYLLKDKRWGKGVLRLSVLAYPKTPGAIWKFTAEGFKTQAMPKIEGLICETKVDKFFRFGDIGKFDGPSAFDAPAQPKQLSTVSSTFLDGNTLYFSVDSVALSTGKAKTLSQRYEVAEKWRSDLSSTVSFTTPDPYLNNLGGALVMATDGAWDGQIWLHGAIGWRMALTGWRGAYAGDFLGMFDRQRIHFDAYAKSQVTDVPVTLPHLMDAGHGLSRGAYKWGTPMYSTGYICRNPKNNKQFHHYDMNLIYIDELLWHFQFDADTAYMRKMWPVIKRHLAWEKNTWDPDNDGLYDAYCCIWASDALQYNSGAVTHSSAYNYRSNMLAARIARILGENPKPYEEEANKILNAMNACLWLDKEGHWAEYQDFMGLKRLHKDAAVWSIYTPIDCGAGTAEQNYRATRYIDSKIPHLPFSFNGKTYRTISTTNWSPYEWSLNNVAMSEVMHTILAYYQVGRVEEAYRLLKANVLDFMYLGTSPANFGQLSSLDKVMGESYRDFTDVMGTTSRAMVEGLYGITPEALEGRCVIRPGFPAAWDSASVHTPYMDYVYHKKDGKVILDVTQNFKRPLKIVVRQNIGQGKWKDTEFTAEKVQHIELPVISYQEEAPAESVQMEASKGTGFDELMEKNCRMVNMDANFNSNVTDIFRNKYKTPRSPYTTLCVPTQGVGDWCSTKRTANIDDAKLRSLVKNGVFEAKLKKSEASAVFASLPFRTPAEGKNIAYTSLWDNYPDSITVALKGKASHAYLMLAGSTNPMQSGMDNGVVIVKYTDGSTDSLMLHSPSNWVPIEQDYMEDVVAFPIPELRPYRVGLKSGVVSRHLFKDSHAPLYDKASDIPAYKQPQAHIDGGAATLLDMPLNPKKKLRSLTLRTLSNEVVIGLMGVTLQK